MADSPLQSLKAAGATLAKESLVVKKTEIKLQTIDCLEQITLQSPDV